MLRLLLLLPLLVLAGCASASALLPSGSFPLVAYNGQPLPAHVSPLPTRDGSSPVCSLQYDRGELSIDEATGRFTLRYRGANSCTGARASERSAHGSFTRRGSRMTFAVAGRNRDGFSGEIVNDQLVVRQEGASFVFQLR